MKEKRVFRTDEGFKFQQHCTDATRIYISATQWERVKERDPETDILGIYFFREQFFEVQ